MLSDSQGQKTARSEHRLGAVSVHYNAYLYVIFGLLNIIDALNVYRSNSCLMSMLSNENNLINTIALPTSLYDKNSQMGAISLFEQANWFEKSITGIEKLQIEKQDSGNDLIKINSSLSLGKKLKLAILSHYQRPQIITK